MVWRVEFLPAAEKELSKLDRPVAQRILAFLDIRVHGTGDPRAVGEALTGTQLGSLWKYRVGDHRVICAIDDGRVLVTVVRIANRSIAYRPR